MFGSRVGFSGTADLMALFPVRKIQDGDRRHLGKISNGHISATGRPIHSMFGSRVGFLVEMGIEPNPNYAALVRFMKIFVLCNKLNVSSN